MNSMPKEFPNDEKENCCKRAEVLLKCKVSNPVTVAITTGVAAITTPLVNVRLNTRCFHDPCFKFEFSTNLLATLTRARATLNFQLYKLCKGKTIPETIGNPWVYSAATTITDIITFILCDCGCGCDNDCCSYYVSVTTSAVTTSEGTGTAILTFSNPTLSALVVGR